MIDHDIPDYSDDHMLAREYVASRSRRSASYLDCATFEEDLRDNNNRRYGDGLMVRESPGGKYRRTRLFLLTLAHSRKSVRLLTRRSSTKIWAQLHEQAFRRLGGVTATVVLDNLREGVLQPDVYDPLLNPLYRDVLAHYGVVALPCRVRDPDRKGKVESGIAHTQKALRGLRFESIEEAQAWLDHWDERWAARASTVRRSTRSRRCLTTSGRI